MGAASDVMNALSVSYVDRMASSDPTRASIVLAKIANVWPSIKDAWGPEVGLNPQALPPQIPDIWDGVTRLVLAKALPDGGSAQVRALADQIGSTQVASQVGPIARRYLEFIPTTSASRTFAAQVAAKGPGDLAVGLDDMIAIVAAGGAFSAPGSPRAGSVFSPSAVQAFRVPTQAGLLARALQNAGREPAGSSPIALPETTIIGQRGGIGIPTWGWWVIGITAVAGIGAGVYFYTKRAGAA